MAQSTPRSSNEIWPLVGGAANIQFLTKFIFRYSPNQLIGNNFSFELMIGFFTDVHRFVELSQKSWIKPSGLSVQRGDINIDGRLPENVRVGAILYIRHHASCRFTDTSCNSNDVRYRLYFSDSPPSASTKFLINAASSLVIRIKSASKR